MRFSSLFDATVTLFAIGKLNGLSLTDVDTSWLFKVSAV